MFYPPLLVVVMVYLLNTTTLLAYKPQPRPLRGEDYVSLMDSWDPRYEKLPAKRLKIADPDTMSYITHQPTFAGYNPDLPCYDYCVETPTTENVQAVKNNHSAPSVNHQKFYRSILLLYPAWKRIWKNRKSEIIRILFRSPFTRVDDIITIREYYIVIICSTAGVLWILYNIPKIKSSCSFHFDTLQVVPAALNGALVNALEMGVRVILGDQTSPVPLNDTYKEHLVSCLTPVCYCFSVGLAFLCCLYQQRPTLSINLTFWITLGAMARLLQASYLDADAAEELLCNFTRVEFIQQEQQAKEEPTLYASTALTNLDKSPIEKFRRDSIIALFVSKIRYIQVAILLSCISILIHISENLQRIIAHNFQELYSNATLFTASFNSPFITVVIDSFVNILCLYISLTVYKIPMLSILITSSQAQGAKFFTEHFPALVPYAYSTRSPPENPLETLYMWDNARFQFFERLHRQMNLVQKPADIFYTGFFLLLAIMLLFSSQTSFFLYNEYGLAITIAALATSFVLLAFVWEGEKAHKVLHYDQKIVFWDWWSGGRFPSVDENLLTRPSLPYRKMSPLISCVGVPLSANATIICAIFLLWIWGRILSNSYKCHTSAFMMPIASE